ncbi:MAG: hypothetical protein ACREBU_03950 [Nitrososphaera sp.]
MEKLLLVSVSLFSLGISIILFEQLVANNKDNFHPCPPELICDYFVGHDQISIGIFPAIVGAMILGLQRVMTRSKRLPSDSRNIIDIDTKA